MYKVYKKVKATHIFFNWVSTKLPPKDLKNLLSYPSAFGESCESEVIRIDLAQT
jgi:hypothetical protein